MGVLLLICFFRLSRHCPTARGRLGNTLIRRPGRAHVCSVPVRRGDSVITSRREALSWR